MSKKKKLICLLVLFGVLFVGLFAMTSTSGYAAGKEAACSQAISGKKKNKIKKMCRKFVNLLANECSYKMSVGSKKTYVFSKTTTRKKAMRFIMADLGQGQHSKNQKKTSKNLFGVSTPIIKPLVGDWGEYWPEVRNIKISKSGSKYIAKANINFYWEENDGTHGPNTIGKATFILKPNRKSKYGFVVKKVTIRKIHK